MYTAKVASGRSIGGREPFAIHPAWCRYGQAGQTGPVVLAIPHAGREYPVDIVARSRVGLSGLRALEDRHADALATAAIGAGHCTLIARRGRALLDLNRYEGDIDNSSVIDIPYGVPVRTSAKLLGGLGLVPHRYHSLGDLWRRRPTYTEVTERIADIHVPYHAELDALLDETRAMHGCAILIDLHSMPPIRGGDHHKGAEVVLGDRFGRSADPALICRAAELAADHGFRVAVNVPYAGGYTLERHGRPGRDIHAVQIEVDRSLYLDDAMEEPGPGLMRCIGMIAAMADMLAGSLDKTLPLAAE